MPEEPKENPEEDDKKPFGDLPDIMRTLADAFDGKTSVDKDDPYGIVDASNTTKSSLSKQIHTISEDNISSSKKSLELADIWLDETITFPRINSNYSILTPLEYFNSIFERLKEFTLFNVRNAEKGFEKTLSNFNDFADNDNTDAKKIIIGPFGAAGNGFGKDFGEKLYKMSVKKSIKSLFSELPLNSFSSTNSGFIFSDSPSLIFYNINLLANREKIEVNDLLLFISLLELCRFRFLKARPWIYKSQLKNIEKFASDAKMDKTDITEIAQKMDPNNMDPNNPLGGGLDPENFNEAMKNLTPNTSKNNEHVKNYMHTAILVETWVIYISLSIMKNKVNPELFSSLSGLIEKYLLKPLAVVTNFVTQLQFPNELFERYFSFWQNAYKKVSKKKIDSFWNHPDFLPTIQNIDDSDKFFESLNSEKDDDILSNILKEDDK